MLSSSATGLTWYRLLAFALSSESQAPAHACVKTSRHNIARVRNRLRRGQLCGSRGSDGPLRATMKVPSFVVRGGGFKAAGFSGSGSWSVESEVCGLCGEVCLVSWAEVRGEVRGEGDGGGWCQERSTAFPICACWTMDHIPCDRCRVQKQDARGDAW